MAAVAQRPIEAPPEGFVMLSRPGSCGVHFMVSATSVVNAETPFSPFDMLGDDDWIVIDDRRPHCEQALLADTVVQPGESS